MRLGHAVSQIQLMQMMDELTSKYEPVLRERLSEGRFQHVCAVRDSAVQLAVRYGGDTEEAALAGLLHDYARELPDAELLRIATDEGLLHGQVERLVPVLLHGPVGAVLVCRELGIDNRQVLQAITLHTLGSPQMELLDRIIYVADLVAEGRDFLGVNTLRQVAVADLDQALLLGFAFSIRYCLEKKKLIHPQTIAAWNCLSQLREAGKLR